MDKAVRKMPKPLREYILTVYVIQASKRSMQQLGYSRRYVTKLHESSLWWLAGHLTK